MFDVYFGAPGSGKSTMACRLALQQLKKGRKVFSNVEIKGCIELDPRRDIGRYDISNALVIIDEAGIEYNNREFKSFSQEQNRWFKLYRHARCDIVIFSQSFEDMDKKLRLLANRYFLVERSLIPKFIRVRRISKKIYINEADKQIIDAYDFVPFTKRLYFGPKYWKHFDSYSMPQYEAKDWTVFGSETAKESLNQSDKSPAPPQQALKGLFALMTSSTRLRNIKDRLSEYLHLSIKKIKNSLH